MNHILSYVSDSMHMQPHVKLNNEQYFGICVKLRLRKASFVIMDRKKCVTAYSSVSGRKEESRIIKRTRDGRMTTWLVDHFQARLRDAVKPT